MKAAIVKTTGQIPTYGDFTNPVPSDGEKRITVTASAISQVAKSRASGAHYSASKQFPFAVGIDGVGRLDDGQRVYFALPKDPYGSMAEISVAPASHCILIPDDLDDITAAAIANPGMSSWAAMKERAKLVAGETVLINGATGAAGRLAVQIAKHLGAKKVIATGRNIDTLQSLKALGADVTIQLTGDATALENSFKEQFSQGVDVVIDYLWGKSAESLLIAAANTTADSVPVRFVQVGALSGDEIQLHSTVLRSSAIQMMGCGIGSLPLSSFMIAIQELLHATVSGGFKIATKTFPLTQVDQAWLQSDGPERIVIVIDQSEFE